MPAATTDPPEVKTEREELLWQALKEHIMLERQKKKEEQEAEVEEERLRKEREARDRQDAMTLGETREQIQLINAQLEELRNEKQQLFLRLKKVLNEDENRKKQQLIKDSEMFALHNMVQQAPHPQIFLPPRAPHQHMHKYLQGVPQQMPNNPNNNSNNNTNNNNNSNNNSSQPIKRGRSPSPIQQSGGGYWKGGQKIEDGKVVGGGSSVSGGGGGGARAVLWNKPSYQNPSGTLYYPTNQQDTRGQSIIYPTYAPNLNMPLRQSYHVDMPPVQQQSSQSSHMKQDLTKTNQNAQVYHINLDQPPPPPSQQHKSHQNMISATERVGGGGGGGSGVGAGAVVGNYHLEMKIDDRKDNRGGIVHQQQQPPPTPQTSHLPDGIVYTAMRPGMPPMHSSVMSLPPQMSNQQQNPKPVGSLIGQGYPSRLSGVPQQSQVQSQQQQQQPPPQQQIHYQRHRY